MTLGFSPSTTRLAVVAAFGLSLACGNASTPDSSSRAIGGTGAGGATVSGGMTSSGGLVTSGGASSGGGSASGGVTGGGVSNDSGGAISSGGANAIGGASAIGGATSSGTNATGGVNSNAGTTATGGVTSGGSNPGTGGGATLPSGTVIQQGDITFNASGGWLEYAFAEWSSLATASGYKVYYKLSSAADTTYVPVDADLLRANRVDIPGLQGKQSYDVKVVPVVGGSEASNGASVVRITTLSHDRSGFAFHSSSPNGNGNGAYNADGTLKSDALVLYVSDATKDTVTMPVTKGKATATYTGLGAIMAARQSAATTVPLAIRIIDKVTAPAGVDSLNLLNLKTNQNITMEGIGNDAQCYGWGLNIRTATNVEVRNLSFYMFTDDSVSVQVDNNNIWIHNNDFMIGANGGGDKALGDGSCDIKDNSNYVTISYNHFQGTGKSSLTGMGDTAEFFVSFHHNFFDGSHSRHPRVRWGTVHVYNNYFKNNITYGAAASEHSNLFVQNNVFEHVVRPMIIASQGHDFKDLAPGTGAHESILSGEAGGSIKQEGNELDAFSASWFNAAVDTGNGSSGPYNDFDAQFGTVYPYTLDTASEGKVKLLALAGRLN